MCPKRNIPALTPAIALTPALDRVTACETVVGLVGACCSTAVSLARRAAPTKARGTVHCHCEGVMWNGVVQRFFWSTKRLRGRDCRRTGGREESSDRVSIFGDGLALFCSSVVVCAQAIELPPMANAPTNQMATDNLARKY